MIALYPGGFKPPHRGHYEVVEKLLNGSHKGREYSIEDYQKQGTKALTKADSKTENIDKVIVIIGAGERNGITQAQSKMIWDVYAKHLGNVEVILAEKNPMFSSKDIAKANPNQQYYAIAGIRSDEDFVDLKRITTFKNTPNVKGLVLSGAENNVRATNFRKAILAGDLDSIRDFFPPSLSLEEIRTIVSNLRDTIIAEILGEQFEDIVNLYLHEEKEEIDEFKLKYGPIPNTPQTSADRSKLTNLYYYLQRLIPQGTEANIFNDSVVVTFEDEIQETADPEDGKAAPYGSGYAKVNEEEDKETYLPFIGSILEYMIDEGMNILPLPEVKLRRDEPNAANFFGKTAYYDPNNKEVVLYIEGRHPKDVCRSFTHEMVHHIQNLEGRLGDITTSNTNEDGDLLELEKEAYLLGNITFRNWEDKQKN